MASVQLVAILFCLFATSLGRHRLNRLQIEKMAELICKQEATGLHEAYQAAFNAGNFDRVLKFYDTKGGFYHFDEKNKLVGRDALVPSLQQLMSHGGEIAIDPEFKLQMKHGIHEFYVYGKMMRRSQTQGPETIFYKQRIIRVAKGHHEAEYRIWTEHLSHAEIEIKPIPHE